MRDQPTANLFSSKATAAILSEATFESGMGAPKSQKSGEVFSCTSYSLQNINGQEVELICLACRGSQCRAIFSTPCQSQIHGRNLQLHADENECRMRSYLYAYANAHEMLMHACNLSGARSVSFISLLLRVCAWLCTRGYMQLRQGLYKRVAAGQGPTAAPYG